MYKWLEPPLQALLDQRRNPHHALLIQGHEGLGLPQLAKAFATALMCENPIKVGEFTGHACKQCASCGLMAADNHLDYFPLSPESEDSLSATETNTDKTAALSTQIKVEAVRALIDSLAVTSHRNIRRVIVVDPADALNSIAANALLKVLEEPPENVVFLLLSSRPGRLLPTIRSRCRLFVVTTHSVRENAIAWLKEQGVSHAQALLEASRGAPLEAQKLAVEFDTLDINTRSKAWIEANLSQVLATAQGLKRPDLKAWLGWWYRFITDCARVAQQGKPLFFTQDTVALRRLADKQPQNRWMEYLSVVESSLRSAEHPLSVALVTDALLVQYCGMLALEQP